MVKIAVAGSLNMDLIIRASHLPTPGETIIGHDFLSAPGGKGANQAVSDAFVAALSIALAEGRPLDIALREASAAGALATTKLGAQPSLPRRHELDQFLKAHPQA